MLNHLFEAHFPGCEKQTSHEVPNDIATPGLLFESLLQLSRLSGQSTALLLSNPRERMESFRPFFKKASRFSNMFLGRFSYAALLLGTSHLLGETSVSNSSPRVGGLTMRRQ